MPGFGLRPARPDLRRARKRPEIIAEQLDLARKSAAILAELRKGTLEVNSAEPSFEFDDEGSVTRRWPSGQPKRTG